MRDTIEMAREAKMPFYWRSGEITYLERLKVFEDLVRADERMGFYGRDKPTECAEGCPPNQICDYCQVVAPVKAMILAEREACAKVAGWLWQQFQDTKDAHERLSSAPFRSSQFGFDQSTIQQSKRMMDAIRARGETK